MGLYPLGRIAFINVAPIYYALEHHETDHPFSLVYGTPAELNLALRAGTLAASSCSSVEFARNWQHYTLIHDLCIASRGPVQSVLLLSKKPVEALAGAEVLLSGQSHTSVVLTKLLLSRYIEVDVRYTTGSVLDRINSGHTPEAVLTIGDEALLLKKMGTYPSCLDLASAWMDWTGLPFVFALWILHTSASRETIGYDLGSYIRASRDWGFAHLDRVIASVAPKTLLSPEELRVYYTKSLSFTLGELELLGLTTFFEKAVAAHLLPEMPEFRIQS